MAFLNVKEKRREERKNYGKKNGSSAKGYRFFNQLVNRVLV
jgi:hypothetical protein